MNKKAQGLSFNTIVLAIIALLILVIVILWATGALGGLFGRTKTIAEVTEADIAAAQSKCSKLCIQSQGISSPDRWNTSSYCRTAVTSIDYDEDGQIGGYECLEGVQDCTGAPNTFAPCNTFCKREKSFCWEEPIYQFCDIEVGGVSLSHEDCY